MLSLAAAGPGFLRCGLWWTDRGGRSAVSDWMIYLHAVTDFQHGPLPATVLADHWSPPQGARRAVRADQSLCRVPAAESGIGAVSE